MHEAKRGKNSSLFPCSDNRTVKRWNRPISWSDGSFMSYFLCPALLPFSKREHLFPGLKPEEAYDDDNTHET